MQSRIISALKSGGLCAFLMLLVLVLQSPTSVAQEPDTQGTDTPDTQDTAEPDPLAQFGKPGPMHARLGEVAEMNIPEGMFFVPREKCQDFVVFTQNLPSKLEIGIVVKEAWWAVFEFSDVGFIKDEDKDKLDADDLLSSLRDGNEVGNKERTKRGWAALNLDGWAKKPSYDAASNHLVWAVKYSTPETVSINHQARLLGREGYVSATLVVGEEDYAAAAAEFEQLLKGFSYVAGKRYSEFKEGDKVAEYGLAAMIAGGSLLVAAKTGLLQKFWKVIVAGLALIGGAIAKIYRSITGSGKSKNPYRQSESAESKSY